MYSFLLPLSSTLYPVFCIFYSVFCILYSFFSILSSILCVFVLSSSVFCVHVSLSLSARKKGPKRKRGRAENSFSSVSIVKICLRSRLLVPRTSSTLVLSTPLGSCDPANLLTTSTCPPTVGLSLLLFFSLNFPPSSPLLKSRRSCPVQWSVLHEVFVFRTHKVPSIFALSLSLSLSLSLGLFSLLSSLTLCGSGLASSFVDSRFTAAV